jgi:hypothetical protein
MAHFTHSTVLISKRINLELLEHGNRRNNISRGEVRCEA